MNNFEGNRFLLISLHLRVDHDTTIVAPERL